MSRAQYDRWVADGRPFRLIDPLVEFRNMLRARGYTVYDIGNLDHLLANPPQDHCPYSATGWPNAASYGVGYAIDIMPNSRLTSLSTLGRWIVEDKQAGRIPWLKYINWEPGDGNCWHDSWQPDYSRVASGDRGHIHISARTDVLVRNGYTPFWRTDNVALTNEDVMKVWTWDLRNGDPVGMAYVLMTEMADNVSAIKAALSGIGGLTADDRAAIQRLTEAVEALNSRLATP